MTHRLCIYLVGTGAHSRREFCDAMFATDGLVLYGPRKTIGKAGKFHRIGSVGVLSRPGSSIVLGIRRADFDAAERDLSEALRLDPGFAEAWLERGNARRARKADEAAAEDYRMAQRINPTLQARIALKGSR